MTRALGFAGPALLIVLIGFAIRQPAARPAEIVRTYRRAPSALERDSLAALKANGTAVRWNGAIAPVAVEVDGDVVRGTARIAVAAPAGTRVRVADRLGVLDSGVARDGGIALRAQGAMTDLEISAGAEQLRVTIPESRKRIVVLGDAGWESRFLTQAVENSTGCTDSAGHSGPASAGPPGRASAGPSGRASAGPPGRASAGPSGRASAGPSGAASAGPSGPRPLASLGVGDPRDDGSCSSRIEERIRLAPQASVTQGRPLPLDTGRHSVVVVLGALEVAVASQVRRFVQDGGGLVLGNGEWGMGDLAPGRLGRAVRPASALSLPSDRADLVVRPIGSFRPGAAALTDAPVRAAVRRVGAGRVVQLADVDTWRLAMASEAGSAEHAALWLSAIAAARSRETARPELIDEVAPRAQVVEALGQSTDGTTTWFPVVDWSAVLGAFLLVLWVAEWTVRRVGARA